ncbi:MAG: hypothetical protein CSB34_04290 [Desulfobulbus propionicus]|nr:MAG: hypothetical protein CSB34_04290 [Desulfobulbus propionicus]
MQILYFRHQQFNSAIREPKNQGGEQLPLHPMAKLQQKKDVVRDECNQQNIQRFHEISKRAFTILSSWQ